MDTTTPIEADSNKDLTVPPTNPSPPDDISMDTTTSTVANSNKDLTITPTREPLDTPLRQQTLPAWHPVLDPLWVMISFFLLGVLLIPSGHVLETISRNVVEMTHTYDAYDPQKITPSNSNCSIGHQANANRTCQVVFTLERDMEAPVLLYYAIDNFYQNHRVYVNSRDDGQLNGALTLSTMGRRECHPLHELTEPSTNKTIALHPCGVIANTLFNDVITLTSVKDHNGTLLPTHLREDGIAWQSDLDYKFSQPDGFKYCPCDNCTCESCTDGPYQDPKTQTCYKYFYPNDDTTQYLYETYPMIINPIEGVKNEHFIVWMRTSALPNFRKLYGWFNQTLHKGDVLEFTINANWIVQSFHGSKTLLLTTTSIIGGKNPQFGIMVYSVGYVAVFLGILIGLKQYLKPRRLGDTKYLRYEEDKYKLE